jgi:transposase
MVVIGVDPHKPSHTAVAVDANGREIDQLTVGNSAAELIRLLECVRPQTRWAVEDCRHVAGALMRALMGAGHTVVMVSPKLMAQARSSARTRGKSDPIDALAVARAALREPDLPAAHLDEQALQIRLLLDHREDLVAERTRMINRLRWQLHDLGIDLKAEHVLNRIATLHALRAQVEPRPAACAPRSH